MGQEILYHCPKCGKDHRLSDGGAYFKPTSAEDILAGERGNRAKANLERHPGASAMFFEAIFRCKCGYVHSKVVMRIYRTGPQS